MQNTCFHSQERKKKIAKYKEKKLQSLARRLSPTHAFQSEEVCLKRAGTTALSKEGAREERERTKAGKRGQRLAGAQVC